MEAVLEARPAAWIAEFYAGRAVAALAADPEIMKKTGRVFAVWDLGPAYGFTDVDGRRPNITTWIEQNRPDMAWKPCDDAFYAYWGLPR